MFQARGRLPFSFLPGFYHFLFTPPSLPLLLPLPSKSNALSRPRIPNVRGGDVRPGHERGAGGEAAGAAGADGGHVFVGAGPAGRVEEGGDGGVAGGVVCREDAEGDAGAVAAGGEGEGGG